MNNPSSLTLRERFDRRALSSISESITELTAASLLLEDSPERDELIATTRGLQKLATRLASRVSP